MIEWLHFHFILSCIGEGNGNPLQCSCLENPIDGGAWWATVHGVSRSQTQLSDFTFTFHFHAVEKEMAIHSSVLAWRIPGMGELGGLPSMGSHRVGHNWSDLAVAVAMLLLYSEFLLWRSLERMIFRWNTSRSYYIFHIVVIFLSWLFFSAYPSCPQ